MGAFSEACIRSLYSFCCCKQAAWLLGTFYGALLQPSACYAIASLAGCSARSLESCCQSSLQIEMAEVAADVGQPVQRSLAAVALGATVVILTTLLLVPGGQREWAHPLQRVCVLPAWFCSCSASQGRSSSRLDTMPAVCACSALAAGDVDGGPLLSSACAVPADRRAPLQAAAQRGIPAGSVNGPLGGAV